MNTEQRIYIYIVENFLLGEQVAIEPSQSLLEAGLLDSTGVMELVAFLEGTFGIEVADDELVPENFDSIGGIAKYVQQKMNQRSLTPRPATRVRE